MKRVRETTTARELRILRARVRNERGLYHEDQLRVMRGMIEDILRVHPSMR